ncbi:uncharacterized protein J3D65DRAFT_103592 [Phyllosticta citribraziliensis]|uniref:Secreted protein n=1 Tax=Phyllosticta citribraziliensis TaxID=989973 RepID=A0ABR1LAV1_9PEZI
MKRSTWTIPVLQAIVFLRVRPIAGCQEIFHGSGHLCLPACLPERECGSCFAAIPDAFQSVLPLLWRPKGRPEPLLVTKPNPARRAVFICRCTGKAVHSRLATFTLPIDTAPNLRAAFFPLLLAEIVLSGQNPTILPRSSIDRIILGELCCFALGFSGERTMDGLWCVLH